MALLRRFWLLAFAFSLGHLLDISWTTINGVLAWIELGTSSMAFQIEIYRTKFAPVLNYSGKPTRSLGTL